MALSYNDALDYNKWVAAGKPQAKQFKPQSGLAGLALDLIPFGRVGEKLLGGGADQITAGELGTEALLSLLPAGIGKIGKGIKSLSTGAKALSKPAANMAAETAGKTAAGLTEKAAASAVDYNVPAFMRRNAAGVAESVPKTAPSFTTPFVSAPESTLKATKPTITERLATTGQQMKAKSGGYAVGAKTGGQNALGIKSSKDIDTYLSSKGVKNGTPSFRLQQVESLKDQAGKQIDDIVSRSNTRVQPTELDEVANKFLETVQKKIPSADEGLLEQASVYANNLKKNVVDNKSLIEFKRTLDNEISYVKSPDAATAGKQQIAKILRDELVKTSNDRIPGIKSANNDYYRLSDAQKFLIQGVKGTKDFNLGGLGGIPLPGSGTAAKAAQAGVGSVLEKGAEVLGGAQKATGGFRPFIKPLAKQAGVRGVADLMGARNSFKAPYVGNQEENIDALAPEVTPETVPETTPDMMAGATAPDSQQLMAAAIQALQSGDVKGYQVLADAAEKTSKYGGSGEGKASLSDTAINTITDLEAGIRSMESLKPVDQTDPISGFFRQFNQYDTEFQNQQADIDRVRQVVGKALEGGVLRKEDEEKYKRILPTMQDTPEVKDAKIKTIMNDLQNRLQAYKSYQAEYGKGAGQLSDIAAMMSANQ